MLKKNALLYIFKDWTDDDVGFSEETKPSPEDTITGTFTGNNIKNFDTNDQVYVLNCYFQTSSQLEGGSIRFTNQNDYAQMLIEFSVFDQCSTSKLYGGGVYMASGGNCVIRKTCSNSCCTLVGGSTRTFGQYVYVEADDTENSVIKILDSSIIHSIPVSSGSWGPITMFCGVNLINEVNISNNKSGYNSAFRCTPSLTASSDSCMVDFCSFRNNTAISYACIHFAEKNRKNTLANSNILDNSVSFQEGIVKSQGSTTIIGCTILNNTVNQGYMFYTASSGQIILYNCTIDAKDARNTNSNVILQTLVPNPEAFINVIICTEAKQCEAEYDAIGTLTPNIKNPQTQNNIIGVFDSFRLFLSFFFISKS